MLSKFFNYFSYYQWWKNLDKFILSLIITLFMIGLFFSLVSTSLIASDKLDTNSYFFFFKHLIFVLIGLLIIFLFSYIDQNFLYKISVYIFFASLILLFLVNPDEYKSQPLLSSPNLNVINDLLKIASSALGLINSELSKLLSASENFFCCAWQTPK